MAVCLACTRWFFYQFNASSSSNHYNDSWNSAEMVIILLQNHRTSTVNAHNQRTRLLAGWLSWWTWQVRTFKSIKNESKFLSTFFLITVSFCFIINTWIAIVAFTRWMRLEAILIVIYGRSWEQKKRAEQTNSILEITRRFFAFSWSLK